MLLLFSFLLLAADPGDQIDRDRLLDVTTIYELTGSHADCAITFVTVTLVPRQGDPVEIVNVGATLTEATRSVLERAAPQDVVHFRDVQSVGDCMRYQKRGRGFALTVR